MKEVKWKILLSGLIAFGIGCKKPAGLQFLDMQHFKVNSINLKSSVISADLRYYNPNNFQMKLKHAEMDISVNNKFVGHSNLDTLMTIPRKDTFLIPVQVQIDVTKLISNSLNVLLSDEFDISLNGKARLGKAGVFFDFPFTYKGKQKLNLFK